MKFLRREIGVFHTTPQFDDEITKTQKKKLDICENHLFRSKEKRKNDVKLITLSRPITTRRYKMDAYNRAFISWMNLNQFKHQRPL